jgi:hypothetical protein
LSLERATRSADPESHVGVFRIREDKFLRPVRIGMNGRELAIEGLFHGTDCR